MRLVDVAAADERQEGHHLLDRHEGVRFVGLAEEHLGAVGHALADAAGQHGRVLADEVLGRARRACRRLRRRVADGHLGQGLDLAGREPHGAGPLHGGQHGVEHLLDDEHFLLGDAQQVVVVGGALDDRRGRRGRGRPFRRPRRADCPARRRSPACLLHGRAGDGRPAGDADQLHVAVLEDRVGRLQRRLGDHADQVVDAQVAVDGLVEPADALGRHAPAAGMRIDHQRVAARRSC